MLYFVSAELTIGYLLFAFCSAIGLFQAIAAYYRMDGIALFDYRDNAWRGFALAIVLTLASAAVFLIWQWGPIFAPGPAGSELVVLFGGAALAAMFTSAGGAALRLRQQDRMTGWSESDSTQVTVGAIEAHLYAPLNPDKPMPAVCMIPGPGAEWRVLHSLAHHLRREGFVALVLGNTPEAYTYPGALALLPAALSFLRKRPDVDPTRLGVLGYDLGGDLAIRAASADRQVRAVVALAPLLQDTPVSMDLLRELTYPQALRWAHDRGRRLLRQELDALNALSKLDSRPVLVISGSEDMLVIPPATLPSTVASARISGARHRDLPYRARTLALVAQWFKERL